MRIKVGHQSEKVFKKYIHFAPSEQVQIVGNEKLVASTSALPLTYNFRISYVPESQKQALANASKYLVLLPLFFTAPFLSQDQRLRCEADIGAKIRYEVFSRQDTENPLKLPFYLINIIRIDAF